MALSKKQSLFVSEYLIDLNATQASIRAGYSEKTADKIGPELLGKTSIQKAIQDGMKDREKRTLITADRTLKEIARIGFFDIRKLFNESGELLPIHEIDDDTAAAISGIEAVSIGNSESGTGQIIKFKIADKNAALEKLCKHLSLYAPQKLDITAQIGKKMEDYTDDELLAIINSSS